MKVTKVVNSVFNSNSYILSTENNTNCWLVDCGDSSLLLEWINQHDKKLVGVFITHTHFDHIYGLNHIHLLFPECLVYTSENGMQGLFSDKLNLSHYNCSSFVYNYDNIFLLKDSDNVELFPNIFLNVISTPGHDWSCLTFQCGDMLFTGDSFLPEDNTLRKFPKSDKAQAESSKIKIKRLLSFGAKYLYPGHGDVIQFKDYSFY